MTKTMIIACVAALVASAGVAASQRISLFYDHQSPRESSELQYIASQTAADVKQEPVRPLPHWSSTMADFARSYARATTIHVATPLHRKPAAKLAAAQQPAKGGRESTRGSGGRAHADLRAAVR
jgi:hypothetical protein